MAQPEEQAGGKSESFLPESDHWCPRELRLGIACHRNSNCVENMVRQCKPLQNSRSPSILFWGIYDYTAGLHPVPLPFTHPLAASGERNLCGWHSLPNAGYGTPHVATGVNQRGQAMLVGPTGWEAQSAAWMDERLSQQHGWCMDGWAFHGISLRGLVAQAAGWGVHRNSIEPSDCCDQRYGPKGRPDCWDEYFTYELCCVGVQSLDSREVVTGWPPWPQKISRIQLISIWQET